MAQLHVEIPPGQEQTLLFETALGDIHVADEDNLTIERQPFPGVVGLEIVAFYASDIGGPIHVEIPPNQNVQVNMEAARHDFPGLQDEMDLPLLPLPAGVPGLVCWFLTPTVASPGV